MALVSTDIISSAAMTSGGMPFQAAKLTLQSATNAINLSTKVVNAATPSAQAQKLFVHYVTSPLDITAAQAAEQLVRSAKMEIYHLQHCKGSGTQAFNSDTILVNGGFLYVWYTCPAWLGNLTCTATETSV